MAIGTKQSIRMEAAIAELVRIVILGKERGHEFHPGRVINYRIHLAKVED